MNLNSSPCLYSFRNATSFRYYVEFSANMTDDVGDVPHFFCINTIPQRPASKLRGFPMDDNLTPTTSRKFAGNLARFCPVLLIIVVWLFFFWPLITGQQVVGFRDAANLYYPLFEWIDTQLAKGELPVWNPFCNYGMPTIHDGSSSIFYPGKLIFFARALPYPARYGLYLSIHILIAALGTYWFSRTLRITRSGSTLAAFSYAFGGAVLFEVVNAPFVVSAAWLPFALCSVWQIFNRWKIKWAIAAAFFCSMMILGGDPQMCYHVGLILCAFAIRSIWRNLRRLYANKKLRHSNGEPPHGSTIASGPRSSVLKTATVAVSLVAVTVIVTFCLSAVQVLPSYVWAKQSIRSHSEHPRTLVEFLLSQNEEQGQIESDDRDANWESFLKTVFYESPDTEHQNHVYQFSQPPWTLSELVWPNFSGRAYPVHQRWVDGLPGAERMWTPSLYAGGFVFVLALLALNPLSRNRKQAWLSRLILFFAVASFGWYGLVWLGREGGLVDADSQLASPVGGLYWLMVIALPKYISFRYPAKLFTVAALAIAVLAGWQLGKLLRTTDRRKRVRQICCAIGIGSVLILVFNEAIARVGITATSPLFGPFDFAGCRTEICVSAVTTLVLVISCYSLLRLGSRSRSLSAALIVAVCCGELLLANYWLVPVVDADVFLAPTQWDGIKTVTQWTVGDRLDDAPGEASDETAQATTNPISTPIQNAVPDGLPAEFFNVSSNERLAEIVRWQREMLAPKFHLQNELHLFNSFASLEPVLPTNSWLGVPLNFDSKTGAISVSKPPIGTDFYRDLFVKRPSADADAVTRVRRTALNRYELELETKNANEEVVVMLQAVPGWRANVKNETTGQQFDTAVSFPPTTFQKPSREEYGIRFCLPAPDSYTVVLTYAPTELTVGIWISAISSSLLLVFVSFTAFHAFRKRSTPAY